MPNRKLGVKIEIDGEKEYKETLANLNAANNVLKTEMQKLQAEYKGNTESTEYLTKAGELLERQLLSQQEKVAAIRQRLEEVAKTEGVSATETMRLQAALNKAETAEINLQHSIEENKAALEGQGETMVGLGDTVDQLAAKIGIHLPEGAKNALNSMESFSAGTVAAMAAAAAGVAALVAVFKELNDITLKVAADADEVLTQSAVTSVPAEMLQAWNYAAAFIDVDADTITGSMTKIISSMSAAQSGSEKQQEAFAKLGVSVLEADGSLRSAQDVFMEVIDALGEVDNQTERAAIGMTLLGKSEQELNPLINAGSKALEEYGKQAEAVGYILSEDELQALSEVDDAYNEMKLTVDGLKKQLAVDFAPASKAAMELFSSVVQKAGQFLERSGLIENLASIFTSLIDIIQSLSDFVSSIPGVETAIDTLNMALTVVAYTFAGIADTIKIIVGLMPTMWGSGTLKEGLGLGYSSGHASNMQRLTMSRQGTLSQYDEFYSGRNATGNDNWRGGLTWVGEGGPELVRLPSGSQIYNAQDSRLGGDTFYITIDAASVKEFNDIVEMAQSARVRQRMR